MVECDRSDLVCLYLAAYDDARDRTPAPPAVSAIGIGDALEVGEAPAERLALLDDLTSLQEAGLVTAEERPVRGHGTPQTVYFLTGAGRERARSVRERVEDERVEVSNGTTEETPLSAIGRYMEDTDVPLVTALARLTDDGTVPVETGTAGEFVGRQEALETVRSAVEAAFHREPRTVLVAGAAGMGKTTLVETALDRVEYDPEPVVARGICRDGPTTPYGPLRQAFEALPDGGEVLARMAPPEEGSTPEDPDEVEARRAALFEDVADRFRSAATERPVVVFLDNLQWADSATLALFEHLATAIDGWIYPVAFVGTYRSPAVAPEDHPLGGVRDRLADDDGTTTVTLEPFDPAATRTLLERVLGTHRLPDSFVGMVHEQTGGVPLFVRETTRHLLDRGIVDPEAGEYPSRPGEVSLPEAVTDGIAERLAALDEPSRELVGLAAVVGERVPRAVLAEASDLPDARRREYLDLLVASRILERPGQRADHELATGAGEAMVVDGSGAVRFVSGGVREAVVERLPADRAAEYHGRVGEAFEAVYGDEQAARIGYHFERAGDHGRAVEYYRRAGDRATETYANEVAATNYKQALTLGTGLEAVGDDTLGTIAADLAAVYRRTGAYDRAIGTVEDGLALAPDRSRARARLLNVKTRALTDRGEYDPARVSGERLLELATDIGARDLEASALDRLGSVAWKQGAYDEAHEFHERSRSVAREIGDTESEARSLHNLGAVAHYRREYDRAREYYERSLNIARDLDDQYRVTPTLNNLGVIAREQGDYDRAREYFERTLAEDRDRGDRNGEATTLMNLGLVASEKSEYDSAREHYERSLDIHREIGNRRGEATTLHNLGEVCLSQGAYDEAREQFERSLAIERDLDNTRGVAQSLGALGRVAGERGEHDRARAYHERSLELGRDIGDDKVVAAQLQHLGRLARLEGGHERAGEHLDRALSAYESTEIRDGIARIRLEQGRLALDRGALESAREHAERASEIFGELEKPHGRAESQLLRGRIAAAAGDPAAAREYWRGALETFEAVETPQNALEVLQELAETCREQGDEELARKWCRRAREVLADAPEATAVQHRDWIGHQTRELGDG